MGLASVSEAHFYDMRKEKKNKIDGSREGSASKEGVSRGEKGKRNTGQKGQREKATSKKEKEKEKEKTDSQADKLQLCKFRLTPSECQGVLCIRIHFVK